MQNYSLELTQKIRAILSLPENKYNGKTAGEIGRMIPASPLVVGRALKQHGESEGLTSSLDADGRRYWFAKA